MHIWYNRKKHVGYDSVLLARLTQAFKITLVKEQIQYLKVDTINFKIKVNM